MLRRLRRPAVLLLPLLLVCAVTVSCGEETTVLSGGAEGTDAVSISGELGELPDVEWKSRLDAGEDPETDVLIEGDGEEVATDDNLLVDYWVGNGYTESVATQTYGKEPLTAAMKVGGQLSEPQTQDPVTVGKYLLTAFMLSQIEPGDTVGTRKAVFVNASAVTGYGGSGLGIGNEDGLVFVIDILAKIPAEGDGEAAAAPAWSPKVTYAEKVPSALDFTGTPAPIASLRKAVLRTGTGDPVEKNDLVAVNYLGQVYGGDEPFDASYSRGTPLVTRIGAGLVVKGWDQAIVGTPVGSRIMIAVPPALGYGKSGNESAGIKGTDTLYFVIDVLAAG